MKRADLDIFDCNCKAKSLYIWSVASPLVVAFYVSDNIKAVPRLDVSSDNIKLILLEITTNNRTLLTWVCYRPQNRTDVTLFLNKLERLLENVKSLQSDVIILMGDFNDKCISWNDDHATSELGKKVIRSSPN